LETSVSVEALMGRCKTAKIAAARRLMYFAVPEVGLGLSEMARYIGRDHSTICKLIHSKDLKDDERAKVEAIKLTAQLVASEHKRRLQDAFSTGVAA
jgi:chromosomal replication initiation ATPase DnaA